MNLSEVLDRSRELVRSRGLDPAFAAVQAVDELAEGFRSTARFRISNRILRGGSGFGSEGVSRVTSADSGSSPIETVALLAVLLLPIAPVVTLFGELSDAMAAESIARHGLRAAVLEADDPSQLPLLVATKVQELSTSWQKIAEHGFSCQPFEAGGLATLEIAVGNALAVQVAGLEPG